VIQIEIRLDPRDWHALRRELKSASRNPAHPTMQLEGSFLAVVAESFPTSIAGYFGRGAVSQRFGPSRMT
jgi:hypothetical protein